MEKRGSTKALTVVLTMIAVIAVIHTVLHFTVYGTGIDGFHKTGISGLSIGKLNLGDDIKNNSEISNTSKVSLSIEWIAIVLLGIFTFVYGRTNTGNDISKFDIKSKGKTSATTDLDILYDVLKEKKKVSLLSIQNIFKINEETAIEWCKILESGNLAELSYSKVGESFLTLVKPTN